MVRTKMFALLAILALSGPAVFGQDADPTGDTGKGEGLVFSFALNMDAFSLKQRSFGSKEIRVAQSQDTTTIHYPFSNYEFWSDSEANLGYEGKFFGGNLNLSRDFFKNTGFGGLRGWVRLGFVKITAGNDIESTYADALDADPGLRLYTGTEIISPDATAKDKNKRVGFLYTNPDNITGSEGLMVEALLDRLTIGLAGSEFSSIPNLTTNAVNSNTYGERYDASFRYGARVGYDTESIGKFNVSYNIRGKTIADSYGWKQGTLDVVATKPIAQSYIHSFGVYATLSPLENLGLTIGYNGELTSYLEEFYNGSAGWVKTGYPNIFKNGVNLNARYKTGGVTLRTDHSLSFWSDKNYDSLESNNQKLIDVGLQAKEQADRYAQVNYFMMWNGIGASFDILRQLSAGVYLRNMLSHYQAAGNTPGGQGTYSLFRDEIALELKCVYRINDKAEAFIKLAVQDLITVRSKDLNAQSSGIFIEYINNNSTAAKKPVPVETLDNELTFSIPVGFTLKFK